ncbi:MAG: hypothetical protein HY834_20560 [Devosia nanyangense]|uniref:Type II secretion system protein n=1 Tax=Devosia nanyangense TaxID=1228055 RepID=A0A933L6S5_9HYPH|nr:hypothetical protein [Devosia nanyangense]
MTAPRSSGEAGFVMIDALMATVLVALAGSTIVLIANGLVKQEEGALDRLVALTMSQSIMKQALLLGPIASAQSDRSDELYTYEIAKGGEAVPGTKLVEVWAVVATPKAGTEGAPERLDFFAPSPDSGLSP